MNLPSTVRQLRDAINSHDPQRVAGCFARDYRCETPMHPARDFVGSDQVRRNWEGMFASIAELDASVLRTAVNDTETWSEWEMTGIGPDQRSVLVRGTVIWTEAGGAITWSHFYLEPVTDLS